MDTSNINNRNLTVVRHSSIDDVDPGFWDSFETQNEIINGRAYLRAVEKSCLEGLEYRYLEIRDNGEPVARASVSLFTFALDVMAGKPVQLLTTYIIPYAKKLLNATVIECGHPTALGSSIVLRNERDFPAVMEIIDSELVDIAHEKNTTLIDIRDVYASERKRYNILRRFGYRSMPNMANTMFRVYQKTYEEYLADLVSKRRHEVLKRTRAFHENGGIIEKIVDFADIADSLEVLWLNTFHHAKEYSREILNADYFRNMSEQLGDRSFVLVCRLHGRIIGFTMLLDSGNTLISTYCGLDYSVNRSMYTYFVLFYRSIEEAIYLGKTWLELGVTNYSPKMEIGATPRPMYIYAKSTNRFVNTFLTRLLEVTSTHYMFEKRRIFNSRFYERHAVNEELTAIVAGRIYRVRDVSIEGIGLEGESLVSRRRIPIEVIDRDGVLVRLSGRLRNSLRTDGKHWRMGFSVRTSSDGYLPLWYNLVRRRESGDGSLHE